MSVLDNLRRKPASGVPLLQAQDVFQQLGAAQAELDALLAQHGNVALDALLKVDGAEARLADLDKKIATGRADVVRLQSAHKAALVRDEQAILQQRASLYKTQLATVKRKLEARDQAATDLVKAFETVTTSWNTMVEASRAAKAAVPTGTHWPEHGLPDIADFDGIKRLVANEMYRQAGDQSLGHNQSFPGSVSTPGNEGQRDAITALDIALKAHTAFVLERLTGRVPGA